MPPSRVPTSRAARTAPAVTTGAAVLAAVLAGAALLAVLLVVLSTGRERAETAGDLVDVAGASSRLTQAVAAVEPPAVRGAQDPASVVVAEQVAAVRSAVAAALDAGQVPDAEAAALSAAVSGLVDAVRAEASLRGAGESLAADAVAEQQVAPALVELDLRLAAVVDRLEAGARADRDRAVAVGALVVLLSGVTALALRRRVLRLVEVASERARFEAVVAGSADVILVSDHEGRVGYASPAVESVMGTTAQGWTGVTVPERVDPRDAPLARALAARALARPETAHGGRLRVDHADGHTLHVDALVHRLPTGFGAVGRRPAHDELVWTLRDVTGAHVMEERLRRLAFYDPLSGLPNRVLLVDRLGQTLARHGGQAPGALVVVDLDRFREVLDVHGRGEGDRLLLETVRRLKEAVPAGRTLARVGSNAFAVVRDDLVGGEAALVAARELVAHVGRSPASADDDHALSCSAGVVLLGGATDAETVLRDAHTALHAAKLRGGRTALLFEEGMHVRAARRLELMSGLNQASGAGELELAYQPVVDLVSGAVGGVEALLRWRHPRLGRVLPDAFVALAEEGGAIDDIGAWALHEACTQAAEWSRRLGSRAPSFVAVNLSARQLGSDRIVQEVADALAGTGLDPGALLLEITETALVDDVERARTRLGELKDLGVRLALDDFGTGYSSLSSLRAFPIDVLKIDRSFLETPDEAVLRGICALGTSLGLRTVVEGVESREQVTLMQSVGCDAAQGFLFAAPSTAADVEQLFGAQLLDAAPTVVADAQR